MSNNNSKLVWHYTTGAKFQLIINDGYLRVAVTSALAHEKAILWFSAHPYWEQTANKALVKGAIFRLLSMAETKLRGGGLVRFGINRSRLHHWPKIGRKARISKQDILIMETTGKKQGSNPDNWYGTTQSIALSRIEEICVMDDAGTWVTVQKGGTEGESS